MLRQARGLTAFSSESYRISTHGGTVSTTSCQAGPNGHNFDFAFSKEKNLRLIFLGSVVINITRNYPYNFT